MKISEHANYLLNEYGRLQFDYAAYCKPYGESLRNEARNNLETYIAELEGEIAKMKKYFHKPAHGTCCTCQKCGHTYDECRCDFDEALDDLDKANARIAELEAEQRFIPVSERLPEEDTDGNTLMVICRHSGEWGRAPFRAEFADEFVRHYTHWMPIPQPPEVQE